MSDEVPLDRDVVAKILRRASDLERVRDARDPFTGIDEASLIAAAEEVGLSVDAVRRSIAFERLGPVPEPRPADRFLGPSTVFVDSEIDAPAEEALARVDAWLVNGHHLRRDALRSGHGKWSKRSGIVGVTVRAIRSATGEGKLGDFERVEATARDVGGRSSLVRVSIDRTANRRFAAGGGTVVAVGGTAGVMIAAAAATPVLLVATPVAVVAGVGVALTGRNRARAAEREIERLLDAVGEGANPTRLSVDVVRRATGKATTIGAGARRAAHQLVPPPPAPPPPLPSVRSLRSVRRRLRADRRATDR